MRVFNRGLNQIGPPPRVIRCGRVQPVRTKYSNPYFNTVASQERLAKYRDRMALLYDKLPPKTDEHRRVKLLLTLDKGRRRKKPPTVTLAKVTMPESC